MKNEDALRRLKIVEGHLRGVIRMMEEDAYCIDIIRQIQAVQAVRKRVTQEACAFFPLSSCCVSQDFSCNFFDFRCRRRSADLPGPPVP